jgi:hypothetical protein
MEDSRSVDAQAATAAAPYPFFPVSTHKFIVLSICSFGLYELYWCYQQWKRLAESSGEALSPFWRAVFAPIFCFSLFTRIRLAAELAGLPAAWPPMLLGAIYFVMSACWRLPEPWFLLGFATVIPMVPAQHTARRLNARFEGLNNEAANEGVSAGRAHSRRLPSWFPSSWLYLCSKTLALAAAPSRPRSGGPE